MGAQGECLGFLARCFDGADAVTCGGPGTCWNSHVPGASLAKSAAFASGTALSEIVLRSEGANGSPPAK